MVLMSFVREGIFSARDSECKFIFNIYGGFIMGLLDNFMRPPQPTTIPENEYEPDINDTDSYDDPGLSLDPAPSNTSLSSGAPIEMRVERPKSYEEVGPIADHLLERKTILLNLEAADKETIRRLIDFLTGVAYAIGGDIKKIAKRTYVVTPKNVDVSGADNQPSGAETQEFDENAEA